MNTRQWAAWRWPWPYRYIFSVLAVVAATAMRFWLSDFLQNQPFPTFFLATLLVFFVVGAGPGLLAVALSGASAIYFFMAPVGTFKVDGASDLARLTVFTIIGVGMCVMAEATRRARQAATDAKLGLARVRLHHAELRLRLAIDSARIGVFEWDVVAGDILLDDRVCAHWGLPSAASASLKTFLTRIHPDDRPTVQTALDRACDPASGGAFAATFRVVDPEYGAERWIAASGQTMFENGRAIRFVGASLDLTDQKRVEAQLRASEDRLRVANERFALALQASPVVVFNQDRDLRFVWVHNSMFGHGAEDVAGKTDYDLVEREEDAGRLVSIKKRVLETGEPIREEVVVSNKGRPHYFDLHVQPQCSSGEIIGVLCTATDITDRKQAEERTRRNELRLRLALDAAYIISFEWDISRDEVRRFVSTDPSLPPTPEEQPSSFEAVRQAVHPEDRETFAANVHDALESADGRYESEFRILHPDGRIVWLYERGRVERDSEGRPIRLVGLSQDITERRRIEEALREGDRRKDEFLATLAHELRNPLVPIRNAVHVLQLVTETPPSVDRDRKLLAMVDRQVDHLVRLVDDLLEVSRITRGKIELKKEPVDLSAILRHAIDTSRPTIEEAGHRLELDLPVDPVRLDADPVRLAQVFTNLLNNAAKYTEPGGTISLTAERREKEVVISVCDTGLGIPAEMLPRIFDLFTQVDHTLRRAQGGLGIGLAIVRSLLLLHGGSIEAHSDGQERGATFVVRLPMIEHRAVGGSIEEAGSMTTKTPHRILVIDDDEDVADSFVMLLETYGATVNVAYDGIAGLQAVDQFRPDVVFLDLGMPLMDGYETARRIRETPNGKKLTLVALTGWGQAQVLERACAAGFDLQLTKPADVGAIQTLLASLESREGAAVERRSG